MLPLYESEVFESMSDKAAAIGDWAETERLALHALEKRRSVVGQANPSLATLLDKLGQAYSNLNRFEKAMENFSEAIRLLESAYYAGHADLAPVLEHQADCLIKQQKYAEAEPLLVRALDIKSKTITAEHRYVLECTKKLAELYCRLDKPADAEGLLAKVMKHVETPLGPAEEFHYALALVYLQQNKLEEATQQALQAIEGFEQRYNYARLAECFETYSNILKQTDKSKEATAASDDAAKYRKLGAVHPYTHDVYSATLMRA